MSLTLRRVAATAAAVVGATALSVPLATPAHAATPTERLWALADTNDDGAYGLSATDLPGGTSSVVDETATADLWELSSSADGSRLAYIRDTATRTQVVVRDIGGRVVRVVADFANTSTFVAQPALAPNGATVAWTQVTSTATGGAVSVRRAAVGAGGASTVLNDYELLGFLDAGTLLVQNFLTGAMKTVPISGGALSNTAGLPPEAQQVAISADGTRIAWSEDTPPVGGKSTAAIHVGALANNSGTWTVTGDTVLSDSLDNEQPAFSRDGQTVYWVQYDGAAGSGEVLSRPFDASTPATTVAATSADEIDLAVTNAPSADVTPPGAATPLPALLNGTSATVKWSLPTDTDLSGVVVRRSLGATVQKAVYLPAPVTSYVDTGLTLGATYSYSFQAVDRSGRAATAITRQLTALKPAPSVTDPTSNSSVRAPFPVTFAATAPTSARFYVDYLVAGTTTWVRWVNGVQGRIRTFGAPAATSIAATTSTPGKSYAIRVLVKDAYGNTSGWVTSSRAVVPLDQSRATLSGGTTVAHSNAYFGSYRRLWATSHYAKITLSGSRLQVIGGRCATCGKVAIYDGSTLVATVDTYSSSTRTRQVLYTRTFSGFSKHTFTLRPKATPGRPNVLLDGFATRT